MAAVARLLSRSPVFERLLGRLDLALGLPASVVAAGAWASGKSAATVFLIVGVIMVVAAGNWVNLIRDEIWHKWMDGVLRDWRETFGWPGFWVCWAAAVGLGAGGLSALAHLLFAVFVGGNIVFPTNERDLVDPSLDDQLSDYRGLLEAATTMWTISGAFAVALALIAVTALAVNSRGEETATQILVPCPNCGFKNRVPGVPSAAVTLRCGSCEHEFQYGIH